MISAMRAKAFRGGSVRLMIKKSDDCRVTDAMLLKGAKFGDVGPKAITEWLEDIASGKYDVVKQPDDAMDEDEN